MKGPGTSIQDRTPEERAKQALEDREHYYYAPGTHNPMVQQWVVPHLERNIEKVVREDRREERAAIIERLRAWRKQYDLPKPSSLDRYAMTVIDSAIHIVEDPEA